ncbi:MAG TPA: translation initiation factor IF-3 [Streptosporangiaceae bacterium]|nr:translation initiation factor IF-3 [Streptosporangiaceae bacterium]
MCGAFCFVRQEAPGRAERRESPGPAAGDTGGHISTEPRINERIRVPEVRLVGPAGEQIGIVAINDALRLAQEADLDLVEVAPTARPPVCKLMDYGKFKYESALKARESRKNQAQTVIKEIKLRPKIDPHDYGTKKGHVERFLKAGDKVKVTIMFRGREQSRPELGFKLLQRLAGDVDELGFVEAQPKQDGRNMIMVIGPHKRKAEAKAERSDGRAEHNAARAERTAARTAASAAARPAGGESSVPRIATPAPARPSPASPSANPAGPGSASRPASSGPAGTGPASRPASTGSASRPASTGSASRPAGSGSASRPAASRPAPGSSASAARPAPRPAPPGGPRPAPPAARPPRPAGTGSSQAGSPNAAAPRPSAPAGGPRPSAPRPAAPRPGAPRPAPPRPTAPRPRPVSPVPAQRGDASDKPAKPADQADSE